MACRFPEIVSRCGGVSRVVAGVLAVLVILAPSGSALAEGEAVADDTPPPGIVFASDVGDTIWAMDANGDNQRQLTTDRSGDPAWSPNGTRIVYTSRQLDEIWVMDTNGGDQKQLTTHGAHPVWSPDGTRILYTSSHLDGIYIVEGQREPSETTNQRRVRPDLVTQRRPHRLHQSPRRDLHHKERWHAPQCDTSVRVRSGLVARRRPHRLRGHGWGHLCDGRRRG